VAGLTFQSFVEQLIATKFETATRLAHSIGMELSPFTRGVRAGTLSLTNLLKLAKVAEAPPSDVLRMAKKTAEAALLEELYGSGRDALTQSRRTLIETWDEIPDDVRPHFEALLQRSRGKQGTGSVPAVPTSSSDDARPPEHRRRRRRGRVRAAEKAR
jgi:hypothetical protein